jgi:hypothetical protein
VSDGTAKAPATALARFASICAICERRIEKGDALARVDHAWVHDACGRREDGKEQGRL